MRKLITESGRSLRDEKCASPDYHNCAVYRERARTFDCEASGRCPYFDESLVQFCGAAPVAKYVPYHDGLSSSCAGDSYRFCDVYLSLKNPGRGEADGTAVSVPEHLYFSPNHMWVDVGENGACHVGIDGFLARLLGHVDRIAYATAGGVDYPSAAISKGGVTWTISFPNPISLEQANLYLRSNPSRLTLDCYGTGWLFSGHCTSTTTAGLIHGEEASAWMRKEMEHLTEIVHELSSRNPESVGNAMNDGGTFAPGFVEFLAKDDAVSLMHQFFGPHRNWK